MDNHPNFYSDTSTKKVNDMIAFNRERSIQELFFKCVLLSFLTISGCSSWQWTDLTFINYSNDRLNIQVFGINPDVSPGNMAPNTDGFGSKAGLHFGDPVRFDDKIVIRWTSGNEEKQQEKEFKRDDLGIPAVMRSGKIIFTYTAKNDWQITYSK